MPQTPSQNPKIVAYTEDGIPLPALPWSDKPEHVLARRRSDEDTHMGIGLYMKMVDTLKVYEACAKRNCRRLKKCSGAKIEKTGRRQGLYEGYPPCFTEFRGPVAEVMREGFKEQK